MNFNLIYNSNRTGYMQELAPADQYIESLFQEPIERWRRDGLNVSELLQYYNDANDAVKGAYLSLTTGR